MSSPRIMGLENQSGVSPRREDKALGKIWAGQQILQTSLWWGRHVACGIGRRANPVDPDSKHQTKGN
ncbi:unnamed protein product [Boreogadus saida]